MGFYVEYGPDITLRDVIKYIIKENGIERLGLAIYNPSSPLEKVYKLRAAHREIHAEDFMERSTEELVAKYCTRHKVLAVESRVNMEGQIFHILQVDFSCHKNTENRDAALFLLETAEQNNGFLLETGNSYHYWGTNLMPRKEWIDYMFGLMHSPLVNKWAQLALNNGSSALRISQNEFKNSVPFVVAKITPERT